MEYSDCRPAHRVAGMSRRNRRNRTTPRPSDSGSSRQRGVCDQGASRSPALAYVFLADQLGSGREASALELVIKIRPTAVPNRLVVQLGDVLLDRDGALLTPLRLLFQKMNEELSG